MRDPKTPTHVVCIPYPAQGHITPMLSLAKLLHSHFHFHITFVNTHHNHHRLLHSRGPNALDGLPSFRFASIPDGLPPSDPNKTQDIPSLSASTNKHCYKPFKELIQKINETSSSVSFILSDCSMSFTSQVSTDMGIPLVFFWTGSAASFLGYGHYQRLIHHGLVPLKDTGDLTNGYLERVIDGIPAMEGIRLKDLPSFVRTTNKDDTLLNMLMHRVDKVCNSGAPIIFHTLDALEHDIVQAISEMAHSTVCSVGPLQLLEAPFNQAEASSIGSNLWKEDSECLEWLDMKDPKSVLYVNFGSITVMNQENIVEMAWGLADSGQSFVWIIRPDLFIGEDAILPQEFVQVIEERGFLASWCDQKAVLSHPSISGFLTHCGWNSVLDSVSNGVPVICWPFFADQPTNCWLCCQKWGVGVEIDADVKRDQVAELVNEVMGGDKGKGMKERAIQLKKMATEATSYPYGPSFMKLEQVVRHVHSFKINLSLDSTKCPLSDRALHY
ncbi:7-deoxyloganetin glucosyltransferase-like [Silene latifolia]|uniref:7-deoxyloganetin glucosyltransferase-like n=1 Tax=Silene latifolia TaxID=37657 RepID=UPI003D780DA6